MRSFLAILVTATTLAILSTACGGQYIYSVDYKLPGCSATTGNDWTAIQVYPLDTCLRESNAAFNNYVRITGNSTHYGSQACNSTIAGCECGPSQCAPLVLLFFFSCWLSCFFSPFVPLVTLLGCFPSGDGSNLLSYATANSQIEVIRNLYSPVSATKILTTQTYSTNCSDEVPSIVTYASNFLECLLLNQPDSAGYSFGKPFCNSTAQYYYGCDDNACTNCTTTVAFYQGASKTCDFVRRQDLFSDSFFRLKISRNADA
jgi:hypothetical protein